MAFEPTYSSPIFTLKELPQRKTALEVDSVALGKTLFSFECPLYVLRRECAYIFGGFIRDAYHHDSFDDLDLSVSKKQQFFSLIRELRDGWGWEIEFIRSASNYYRAHSKCRHCRLVKDDGRQIDIIIRGDYDELDLSCNSIVLDTATLKAGIPNHDITTDSFSSILSPWGNVDEISNAIYSDLASKTLRILRPLDEKRQEKYFKLARQKGWRYHLKSIQYHLEGNRVELYRFLRNFTSAELKSFISPLMLHRDIILQNFAAAILKKEKKFNLALGLSMILLDPGNKRRIFASPELAWKD